MNPLSQQVHRQLPQLNKADIHIHSNYSDGKPSIKEILEYVEKNTDLAVIAITDHNTIDGALEAKKLMRKKKYRFELVVGEEISTIEGHILGLYLKKTIPGGLTAHETLKEIREQGGIAIAAHPYYATRMNFNLPNTVNGVGTKELLHDRSLFAAVETVNATPLMSDENLRAKYLNRLFLFRAETGSSDAHILEAIGKGYTLFEGKTVANFREAIETNQTQAMNNKWDFKAIARYAFFYFPRGLRVAFHTLIFGPDSGRREIINFPSRFRIKREIESE